MFILVTAITAFTYLLHVDGDVDEYVAGEWRQLEVFISVAMDIADHVTILPRDTVLKVHHTCDRKLFYGPPHTEQLCRFSLLPGRNVRWARRMLPLVSHVKYYLAACFVKVRKKERRTDGRVTLCLPLDAANLITKLNTWWHNLLDI